MPRRKNEGEVWRYHDRERVRLRHDSRGWWFKADSQGRYDKWVGPYTTEDRAFYAAALLIETGFTGEVKGGS